MRSEGHRNTTVSGDTRVDWSEAYELVPSLQVGYVWHAGLYARAVAAGLERIGFEIASQVIWGGCASPSSIMAKVPVVTRGRGEYGATHNAPAATLGESR